jgi:hypothetical protein
MRPLLRRLSVLALTAAAGTASPALAAPPDDFEANRRAYQAEVSRPSLQKRTRGRIAFARTKDPRARDVLTASYRQPEEPSDHVAYSIVSIVASNFDRAQDLPAFAAWRAANGKPQDAWLWHRTLVVDRQRAGPRAALETALAPGDPCLRAAALAAVEGDDPAILAAIPKLLAVEPKDAFERALLVEAAADALSTQAAQVGTEPFHAPAVAVIRRLDDPELPPRSRLVVARRLAKTFGKPHAVFESRYWNGVLLAAEGAEQTPETDDRYAPPKPPTFAGVPATGKRIVYLIDLSDSMMAPISVEELTQLRKPRGDTTPGDDAGTPPPPPPATEEPAKDPLADAAVDWKKVKTRFDAARELLKASLAGLAPDASFAVVFFGTKAELAKTTPGMTPAAPAAVRRTAAELDAIKPGRPHHPVRPHGTLLGHTNVHGAFRIAYKLKESGVAGPYEYVRSDTFFQGCDTIFLLSDGDPSYSDWAMSDRSDPGDHAGDPESKARKMDAPTLVFHGPYSHEPWILDDLRRMNLLRRVEIHAVGIGEVSGRFLKGVAAVGGGRVRRIAPEGEDSAQPK